MIEHIDSLAALEAVIGKTPPAVHLKVIDHLDEGALRWIAASPLMFTTFGEGTETAITIGGGAPGFASGETGVLRLPLASLDDPGLARPGSAFGSLFLAPGIGETLRVNGTVIDVSDGEARVTVRECYGHCAKALIRSDFWSAPARTDMFADTAGFVAATRFMALATSDGTGDADLSPKGDPAGCMVRMDGDTLWFADRPGNRRVDSFRNIVVQPHIAALLLVPGSSQVVVVKGTARITTDEAQRAQFEVRDKVPLLAIGVTDLDISLRPSPALERARLWPLETPAEGLDPAKLFVTHVKLNKSKSLMAGVAGAVMSIPGLMRKGLESDYKKNLY